MAYLRTFSVDVNGTVLSAEDGSGDGSQSLDVNFTCDQATTQSSPLADIRVYNVNDTTARSIPVSGGVVTLQAGYKDEGTSIIYKGELRQRRIGREDTVRTFVDLFCAGGDNAYNFATVSKTVAKGSMPQDHFDLAQKAMGAMGVDLGYVEQALLSKIKYPRAVSFHEMARDTLRRLAHSVGAEWFIRDQKLYFLGKASTLPGGGIAVNSQTGMIGQPTETPNGIEVKTVLTGKIGVGSLLIINEKDIQRAQLDQSYTGGSSAETTALQQLGTGDGSYKVLKVQRRGHYRGQEWYNNCVCIGAKTGIQPASLSGVIGGPATTPNFTGAAGSN